MGVGKRIAELRKKQGLTQEQLAEMLSTTRQAVSKWESEKSTPDIVYVISMGKIFGVSMDYLLLGMEPAVSETKARNGGHNKERPPKRNKTIYILLMAAGILILLLCPLFATIYRNYISEYGPALTDPYLYLNQWPLLGIKILGILCLIVGIGGLALPSLRSSFHQVRRTWKEQ